MVRYKTAAFQGLGLQTMVSVLPGGGVGTFKTFNGQLVAGVEDAARPINHRAHYINLDSPRAPHSCNNSSLANNKHLNPRMTTILSDRRKISRSKIRVETRQVRKSMDLEMARKCLLLLDNLQQVRKQRKDPSLVLLSRQRSHLHLQQKLCQTLCRRWPSLLRVKTLVPKARKASQHGVQGQESRYLLDHGQSITVKLDLIDVMIVEMIVEIVTIVKSIAHEMIGVTIMTIVMTVDLNTVAQGVSGSVSVIGNGNESDHLNQRKR